MLHMYIGKHTENWQSLHDANCSNYSSRPLAAYTLQLCFCKTFLLAAKLALAGYRRPLVAYTLGLLVCNTFLLAAKLAIAGYRRARTVVTASISMF